MRRYPVGVAVATVEVEGTRLGLTLSSLVSLALEPPLVGISIARQAAFHELLREAGGFAVSLLAGDQLELAQHFARGVPPIAMWHGRRRPRKRRAARCSTARSAGSSAGSAPSSTPATTPSSSAGSSAPSRAPDKPPLLRLGGDYRSA